MGLRRVLAITAAVALLLSCTAVPQATAPQPSTAGTPAGKAAAKDGGVFVYALPGEMQYTDPALSIDSNSDLVHRQVMEGLIKLDPTGAKVLPVLATSWDTSADGKTHTFKLRSGVKFHDGTDFNAEAVKVNFDRWKNFSKELQTFANRYRTIFSGFGPASNVASVEVVDPLTVRIQLAQPRGNFLVGLSQSQFFFSSPKALKDGDADNADFTKNRYAKGGGPSLVGTGPFMFKEWVPNDHVTVSRNPNYWGDKAHVDSITFRPFKDQASQLNALQAGEIDAMQLINPTDAKSIESDPKLQVIQRGESCNGFTLAINSTHNTVNNKDIRMAIGHALNRQSYIDAFYAGYAKVADNFAPMNYPYVMPMNIPKYDPQKAREAIQRSGIANPTLDFWYPSDVTRPYMPDPKGEFEAMSRDLEAVGFKVVPHTSGWTTGYLSDVAEGKYPMFFYGSTCSWPSIDSFYVVTYFAGGDPTTGVRKEYGYGSPELTGLLNTALSATGEENLKSAWTGVQTKIANDLPMIPLLNTLTPGAARSYVQGYVPSGTLAEYMNTVWLDK